METEVVIGIGTKVVIEITKINPTGTEVEIVIEMKVKKDVGIKVLNVTEIKVMIVIEIKIMTVIEIEIDMTITILKEVEVERDQGKKEMKNSRLCYIYIQIFFSSYREMYPNYDFLVL